MVGWHYLYVAPTGRVGIGTATPAQALDVDGNVQFSGALMPAGNPGAVGQVLISQGPGLPPHLDYAGRRELTAVFLCRCRR